MTYGNKPVDGGNLILTQEQKENLVAQYPEVAQFVRPLYGSFEYMNGKHRWCLWITNEKHKEALSIVPIAQRVENVRAERLKSKKEATKKLAKVPYQFGETRYSQSKSLIVPRVTSERRKYIVAGYLSGEDIVLDSAQAIYDADLWVLGVVSSSMHMIWVRSVGGQLETRIRYSSALAYNTFPIRTLLDHEKLELETKARDILFTRENHSELSLADMYDPDKMPEDLVQVHYELDQLIDSFYRSKPYSSDEERLADLFALYEQMINEEKQK